MMKSILLVFSIFVLSVVYLADDSYAEISENQAFLLEGTGFAVTEEFIKVSEINFGILSQDQRGSTFDFITEDGYVTLDSEEFVVSNLEGKFLREGKYIRLSGNIEGSVVDDTSISFFGRLIDESKDASIYGFTGRITTSDETFKVVYTTKLSFLSKVDFVQDRSVETDSAIIYMLRGSSSQGIVDSYIDASSVTENSLDIQNPSDPLRLRYFSQDRISIEPGTVITIVNNDVVSHSIVSGKENYGNRHDPFTFDGRISTGDVLPGKSVDIHFDDAGFYRLYDPNYPWMKIVAYVFPNSDSLIFGTGKNLGN